MSRQPQIKRTPKLYSVPEAADLMSIDRSQVYILINQEEISWVNLTTTGRRPRIRIEDVEIERFIAKRRVPARAA